MRRYNPSFERDFAWYLSMRHTLNFDGANSYLSKRGEAIIRPDKKGVDGKRAFFEWDSNGKILPTRHPNLLHTLLKVKGSVNLHIKLYAEDRASGLLPLADLEGICREFKAPEWFFEAVQAQRVKYWRKCA